ncbi:MAG: DUF3341 domain-containing protein [Ignavibacteria bacterium]|nr:DUF3341 domain-containing protein [Ignavibacteria bacterium]
MYYKFLSKQVLTSEFLDFCKYNRYNIYIISKNVIKLGFPLKVFSFHLFWLCLILSIIALSFQYYVATFETPMILSSKPDFNLLLALPFAFEVSMLFLGFFVFFRFFVVNLFLNKFVPLEVRHFVNENWGKIQDNVLIITLEESLARKIEEEFKVNFNKIVDK